MPTPFEISADFVEEIIGLVPSSPRPLATSGVPIDGAITVSLEMRLATIWL